MNKRTVRPEPGRKYFNHMHYPLMGRWAKGAALRDRLLDSGQYVHSRPVYRSWGRYVDEEGTNYYFYPDDLSLITCHCGRIACRHHEEYE